MSEEIIKKILDLKDTQDLQRKKELASEIYNETSDLDLKREMKGYLKFHEIFHLT